MKTTVVNGVLPSYDLMLATYLGGVVYRAVTILCGSDTVTDPVTGWIISGREQDPGSPRAHF